MSDASLLLCNVQIAHLNGELTAYRALEIQSGKIVRFFTEPEPKQVKTAHCLDAKGGLLLPAFCDSHTHFSEYGLQLTQLNLSGLSLPKALEKIRKKVQQVPKGRWITGSGWTRHAFGAFPTAAQLDAISTEHFIALRSADWHAAWCNSPVLEKLHPNEFSAEELPRDECGRFKSVAFERAAKKAMALVQVSSRERQDAIELAQEEFFRLGITETLTMEEASALADYHAVRHKLRLRVRVAVYLELLDDAKKFYAAHPDTCTTLEAAKLFLDGSLGSETCSMLEPFDGQRTSGMDFYADADLIQLFKLIEREGLSISVHAIGDKAVRRALNAFEQLRALHASHKAMQLAHRIEHAQTIHDSDVGRFAALGVVASMQPIHIRADIAPAQRLLGARTERLYRFQSLCASGATLIFGSDAPVETPNVLEGLLYAVARCDAQGQVWHAQERLSLQDALKAYTSTPREVIGACRGTLQVGSDADLVLLSENIFQMPVQSLTQAQILATILDGKVVHSIL
ncbi:MAG: amidohydrolase [Candidatus Thermochlorobacter sp.]